MRCVIPQIRWNSCQQILSVDVDPSCTGKDGFYRIVTVGADTNLCIWHVSGETTINPTLKCMSELNRHQKAVNIVRFSPDGNWIASGDDDAYIIIWRNDRKSDDEEVWSVDKSLRKHVGDVTDLCWSKDSNFLVSSSVDSSAALWDVKKGTTKYLWTEHTGYVHGVSYDPLSELAASISIDRTLRLFDVKTGKLRTKVNRYQFWSEDNDEVTETDVAVPAVVESEAPAGNVNGEADGTKKKPKPSGSHMFHDDGLATFCRRLAFSPNGEFLMVPAGLCPTSSSKEASEEFKDIDSSVELGKKGRPKNVIEDKNAIVVFCRNDLSVPCAIIPTGSSYSLACRFNPLYFKRSSASPNYGQDMLQPIKKDDRRIYCTGLLKDGNNENDEVLLDCPFRLIYAVATNNTVIIGATDKTTPLAVVHNIHFARLTDLAWSSDGRVLMVSSTDGYCSIITFDVLEFGEVLTDPPTLLPFDYPMPVREQKSKAPKVKTTTKKDKTPSSKKKKDEEKNKSPTNSIPDSKNPEKVKKVRKIKPVKLDMEPTKDEQMKTPIIPSSSDANKCELPNPFVQLARLSEKDFPPPLVNTEENDDIEKSPAPIKLIPQRNTLDKWVVRKAEDGKALNGTHHGNHNGITPKRETLKRKPETPLISTNPNKKASEDLQNGKVDDDIEFLYERKDNPESREGVTQAASKPKTPRRVPLITLSKPIQASEKPA